MSNAAFSKPEYARRIRLTRKAMENAGLDVIFITDPSNQAGLLVMTDGLSMSIRVLF